MFLSMHCVVMMIQFIATYNGLFNIIIIFLVASSFMTVCMSIVQAMQIMVLSLDPLITLL